MWKKIRISCFFVLTIHLLSPLEAQTIQENYPGLLDEALSDLQESVRLDEEEKYQEFLSSRQQSGFIPIPVIDAGGDEPIYAELDEVERLKEAKSAHYSFSESVQDTINDHAIERVEERDGLKLKGLYSYSDGFFKRTVHYEADENGYRVIKEEIEPIGDGPQYNPKGKATVETSLTGRYSITAEDNPGKRRHSSGDQL
ncbi:uncharacterized protein LOC132258705 [Phlebotomus argentipes]|uniref:uncharacterized protein LOC132258705 n=1 Tax=Phlebotomus argentipes TaxID=94469 RepID=UPI0028929E92|nr:uncharacterized protein LOC132258705 [Phlebotomus argentipes]